MKKSSRVYIAGHSGFIGSALTRRLQASGYKNLILKTREELDLTQQANVDRFFSKTRPEYVFLLAAKVGGIAANSAKPADFIYENLAIQTNVIQAAYRHGVKKLIFPGSSCMYPKHCPQPMKEEYLLSGPIEPTNEPFALAKICGVRMCQAYNRQLGAAFISVVPATAYGPGENFTANGHVMAGLISRFCGKNKTVSVWGTGKPRREFIYIDDLVDALVFLMLNYRGNEIINIGTGEEISIRRLAEFIKKSAGFKEKMTFDHSRPDGMPRRLLDAQKIRKMGWRPRVSLKKGIDLTCAWYQGRCCP